MVVEKGFEAMNGADDKRRQEKKITQKLPEGVRRKRAAETLEQIVKTTKRVIGQPHWDQHLAYEVLRTGAHSDLVVDKHAKNRTRSQGNPIATVTPFPKPERQQRKDHE